MIENLRKRSRQPWIGTERLLKSHDHSLVLVVLVITLPIEGRFLENVFIRGSIVGSGVVTGGGSGAAACIDCGAIGWRVVRVAAS